MTENPRIVSKIPIRFGTTSDWTSNPPSATASDDEGFIMLRDASNERSHAPEDDRILGIDGAHVVVLGL